MERSIYATDPRLLALLSEDAVGLVERQRHVVPSPAEALVRRIEVRPVGVACWLLEQRQERQSELSH